MADPRDEKKPVTAEVQAARDKAEADRRTNAGEPPETPSEREERVRQGR